MIMDIRVETWLGLETCKGRTVSHVTHIDCVSSYGFLRVANPTRLLSKSKAFWIYNLKLIKIIRGFLVTLRQGDQMRTCNTVPRYPLTGVTDNTETLSSIVTGNTKIPKPNVTQITLNLSVSVLSVQATGKVCQCHLSHQWTSRRSLTCLDKVTVAQY